MQKQILVAMTVLAAAVGCSPPADKCGSEICTKEQRCSIEKKCVTDGKPIISLAAPLDMAKVTTNTIEVRGNAQDDDTPPLVELSVDLQAWIPTQLDSDGGFVLQMPIPKVDGSSISITARARDSKAQEQRIARTVNVDNTPPQCSLTTPLTAGMTNSLGNLVISMLASDGSLNLIDPKISTDGAVTFAALTTSGNGMFSYSWALPVENGGSHDVVFRVSDSSGNTCEAKTTVLVDNVKPTVAFTMPPAGSLLAPAFFSSGGKVGGTAADGARLLKSVTLDFADNGGARPAVINGGTWSVAVPSPTGSDYKTHVATVVATDLSDNTASATLSVIVDVKPPVLTITNPAPNAKLNVQNFLTTGNAPLTWTLTDGDPQLVLGLVQTDGGFVVPPVLPTSATDNPKTYSPLLRANDRAGNISTASVTFTVDRVLPTVTTSTPANDTRMFVGDVSADFSEPMTFGVGLALNPNVVGTWPTPSRFVVTGLAKDTVYTVTTGMTVTDLHGNLVVPINYRFHTETMVPVVGALLGTGYREVYDATTDSEGALNVLAYALTSGNIDWLQFNTKTGNGAIIDSFPVGTFIAMGNLVAARSIQTDLSSRRLAGVWFFQGGDSVRYNINYGAVTTIAGGQAFIPTPPLANEGTGLAEFGTIAGGLYKRTGRSDLSLGLPDVDRISVTDTRWEIVRHVAGGTSSASFGCQASCGSTPVKNLGGAGSGTPNSAASKSCSIHGYLNGTTEMTTIFRYQPGCGGTNPCAADINEMGNFDKVVADPAVDGTFYGYNYNSSNNTYQIKKRVLSAANCTGAITNVGLPISLGTVQGQPAIVVIRGSVGLIYADSGYLLKFVGP